MSYTPKLKTTDLEAPAEIAPFDDGGEPFTATIRMTFTQHEARAIGATGTATWGQLKALLAPFIVGWNIEAESPASGGVEQFEELSFKVMGWLLRESQRVLVTGLIVYTPL